ncbi:MAG: site-specific integrase [Ignavibacteriales bacterium]|nr:site-specific integrase [Ignavibacteriales bacterium]
MPTLFKRSNGIFYIVTDGKNGRRRWISTGERTRARASKHLETFEDKPRQANQPKRLSTFISEFLSRVSSFYSTGTLGIYRHALKSFLSTVGDLQLATVSAQHIDLFRQRRIKQVSPITLNINLRALRSAFYYAIRWQILSSNPFTRVPLSRVPERDPIFFSSEDFKLIVGSIRQEWFRSIVILAACTGMRRGEIVNLRWKDVDLSQKVVRVHSSSTYRTKSGKRRVIPLNVIALQLLERLDHKTSEDYVFTIEGRRVRDLYLSRKFSQHVHRLGFPIGYHFHSLRHSFASWLVQNGAPIYEVQKLMGHSTIQVTEIYAHLAPSQLHNTVERLSQQLTMS